MKTQEELYTWIENYLAGELTGDALKSFEERLQSDQDFARQVNLHRNLAAAFQDPREQELAEKLKTVGKKFSGNENQSESKVIPFWRNKWVLVVAASIALLAFLLFPDSNDPKDASVLYAEYHSVYPAPKGLRSDSNDLDSVLSEGYIAYNNGKYELAYSVFTNLLNENTDHPGSQFYAGLCQLEQNQSNAAIAHFQKIVESNNSLYVSQAKWYMVLAYLQMDQTPEAKRLLRELDSAKGKVGEDAKRLLGELGG